MNQPASGDDEFDVERPLATFERDCKHEGLENVQRIRLDVEKLARCAVDSGIDNLKILAALADIEASCTRAIR